MRILIGADVAPDPNAGAAGDVLETNHALRALGHEVDEIWTDDLKRRISHGNLHYILELPRAYQREMEKRLKTVEYDFILFSQPHCYRAFASQSNNSSRPVMLWRSHGLEAKVEDALARHRPPDPISLTRRASRSVVSRLIRRAQRSVTNSSDGAVVGCTDDAEYLTTHFGADPTRVEVIPAGIPRSYCDTHPAAWDINRARRLLYVSQYSPFKWPEAVLAVAERLAQLGSDLTLTWVCSKDDHPAIRSRLSSDASRRTFLIPWQPQAKLMDIYDAHGFLLFTSFAEGWGKVVPEAMARGLCVIASNTSGPKDTIINGENGLHFRVGDFESLWTVLKQAVTNDRLAVEISANAREHAITFSWERCACRIVDFASRVRQELSGRTENVGN